MESGLGIIPLVALFGITTTILTYWYDWIMLCARRERLFNRSKDDSFIGFLIEWSFLIKGHLHFSDKNLPARFIVIGYYPGPLLRGVISYLSSRTPKSDLIPCIPLVLQLFLQRLPKKVSRWMERLWNHEHTPSVVPQDLASAIHLPKRNFVPVWSNSSRSCNKSIIL